MISNHLYCSQTPPATISVVVGEPLIPIGIDVKKSDEELARVPFRPLVEPHFQPVALPPLHIEDPRHSTAHKRHKLKKKHVRCFLGPKKTCPMRCICCIFGGIACASALTTLLFPILERVFIDKPNTLHCPLEFSPVILNNTYGVTIENCGECGPLESTDYTPPFCAEQNQTNAQLVANVRTQVAPNCGAQVQVCLRPVAVARNQTCTPAQNFRALKQLTARCASKNNRNNSTQPNRKQKIPKQAFNSGRY
jgi:hypothetical protein